MNAPHRVSHCASLALAAALAIASIPASAGEVYVDIGIGAPATVVPSAPAYYAPPPVYAAPQPVYAPRPVVVAPPVEMAPAWRWSEDDQRWRQWRRHPHRRWHREDDDDDN